MHSGNKLLLQFVNVFGCRLLARIFVINGYDLLIINKYQKHIKIFMERIKTFSLFHAHENFYWPKSLVLLGPIDCETSGSQGSECKDGYLLGSCVV